ncbi:SDR family NAD(P)-dependent oxidoreductase [Propionicicella superfundia]|uniref:SDR family NAD(P)-dependent oxidoreductase n=1 Tax=Propionicicella superfundia TaxID=348582 RepID=UPI0003F6B55F|nr:SDR family oxidoreductase [Propionicicella superfundia]
MTVSIDLSDQIAIVTGAARGFGRAIAVRLAEAGAQVVVADVLEEAVAEPTLRAIAAVGAEPVYAHADLGRDEGCHDLIAAVVARFGRVDVLVNNAAVTKGTWEQVFAVNVFAPHTLNEAAFEDMRTRRSGKIVNITTSGTFSGGGDGIAYNASKGAADSMTRYQARRFAAEGVALNAVAPGPMLTDMMEAYFGSEVFTRHYTPQMPAGRVLTPEDVSGAVLFLCSPLSDALCGETLLADAGRVRLSPW